MLGDLAVTRDGEVLPLPASRKTRGLLSYLALTRRPQRRDRLCEIFWELPDDPRGSLRWSLSKLRAVVNCAVADRLVADRERVAIDTNGVGIDIAELHVLIDSPARPATEALAAAAKALRQPLLAGLDLPSQDLFQAWLVAEREDAERLRRRALMLLAQATAGEPDAALTWRREWVECDPLNPAAATALVGALRGLGRTAEASAAEVRYRETTAEAGLEPVDLKDGSPPPLQGRPTDRQLLMRQKIRFCTAADGVRIAYASVGGGPPLVKAANWLNHLELDWDAPIWAPLFRELARDHCFIRYDERGNGLSDWNVADLSFPAFVRDLEAVVDAAGLDRFPLIGISQGCAVAIEYAARHPERVTHLVLWGGYAAGWRISSPELAAEREAVITLVRQGWGRDDPVYRQIFSSTFLPSATLEELNWFNEFQRQTTSADNAARFLEVFAGIDVRRRLSELRAPTLVMHARGDRRIPLAVAGALAAGIPNAEFVTLDSDDHILLGREPASAAFVGHVRAFIDASDTPPGNV